MLLTINEMEQAALNRGLYFRPSSPLAVISGAGIAGLAASFELRARGFNVIIAEKRESFTRSNIINLDVTAQIFLKRFNLLETFEQSVGARLTEHRYLVINKQKQTQPFMTYDVRDLRVDESLSITPENCPKLFEKDGIYSVRIGTLQTFFAENALDRGVQILGNAGVEIKKRNEGGGVAKVQLTADRTLCPELFFIAEGTRSTTTSQLGMESMEVENVCSGENWVFGNLSYCGKESSVTALIDTSERSLRIANVIFNALEGVINIAVTSDRRASRERIEKQILSVAEQLSVQSELISTVDQPVHIVNRKLTPFSLGNVFAIGDAARSSSPLAGNGGSQAVTLVPEMIRQLINDYELHPELMHQNFNRFSEASATRWIEKSENVKRFCLGLFEKEGVL